MEPNSPGIPPAVEHPLWRAWFHNGFADDRHPYGVRLQLHHYVRSYEALMSILASRTLWASDIRSFEDTTEFEHGLPMCNEALELIQGASLRQHVGLVRQGLGERFRQRTFVCCFSTRSDLQSQWHNYADEQRGFAITFDSLVISALDAPLGYMLMPVEYGREAQRERARRAVLRALNDLDAALPRQPPREAIWTVRSRFVLLAAELFFLCASFKAANYSPEHEWRLIYTRDADEIDALPIATRVSTTKAIDYVVIDLQRRFARQELPTFASIRLGPRSNGNTAALIRQYIRDHAAGTQIEQQPPFP